MARIGCFLLIVLLAAPLGAEEKTEVRVERVEEILATARPQLTRLTGLEWPAKLIVERTDPAGLEALLLREFERQVEALHPERTKASRRMLSQVLARSFARVVRAKYGLKTKKIHVSPGALAPLPEGVVPDRALVHMVVHEAVHAMDDRAADLSALLAKATDGESLRALRMVIEGRAEHYGDKVARILGVPATVGDALEAQRDAGERLTRRAGREFIAALEKRDAALPLRALKEPPTSTSVIFHPERFGREPVTPDPAPRLAGLDLPGDPEPLSELLLRKRLSELLEPSEVEEMFAGFLAGAAATAADRTRITLTVHEDDGKAGRFLRQLRRAETAGGEDAPESGSVAGPDGRWFWSTASKGRWVVHVIGPQGGPWKDLMEKVLAILK